ncbi:MAG: PH domain-containing protein [bacterium]|nr:PH domain-containing protein [bacterium]
MPDIYTSEENKKSEKTSGKKKGEICVRGSKNPLSAYILNPVKVRFSSQADEEQVILLLRKHWITNVPWMALAILLFFAPLVLPIFPLLDFLPTRYQLMSLIIWYLLLLAFIFESFLTWFFNVYIVTDERLIDVDFYNLIYKQITEAKADKIQDTTYRVGGVLRSVFNFGDVLIQTAGAEANLEFEAVPNPNEVVKVIQDLRTQEEIEALEGRVR